MKEFIWNLYTRSAVAESRYNARLLKSAFAVRGLLVKSLEKFRRDDSIPQY